MIDKYLDMTLREILQDLSAGDMFWDKDNPEYSTESLMDTAHEAGPGCICQIMRAIELPDVYTVWFPRSDEDQDFVCATVEEAEAWLKAQREAKAGKGS
jgi:hypothetical protein